MEGALKSAPRQQVWTPQKVSALAARKTGANDP